MFRAGAIITILCLAAAAFAEQPVQPGDLVLALSQPENAVYTLYQFRPSGPNAATWISQWTTPPTMLRSVEFDNSGGPHSATGNLLALRYGPAVTVPPQFDQGGDLVSLSTDGSHHWQLLFRFSTAWPGPPRGIANARCGGLSISPANQRIACIAIETGSLIVMNYDPGPTPGAGQGAAVSSPVEYTFVAQPGIVQGTAWLDEEHLVVLRVPPAGVSDEAGLWLVGLGPGGMTIEPVATLPIDGGGVRFSDVEFGQDISPFVFCAASSFVTSTLTSRNHLYVIDPADWSIVRHVTLHNSMRATSEIALAPDRRLYLGEYAGGTVLEDRVYAETLDLDRDHDGVISRADILALPDDGTVDYIPNPSLPSFIQPCIDVAQPPPGAATGACCATDGSCGLASASACAAAGGTYLGDGAACEQSSCDPCAASIAGDSNCDQVIDNSDIDCFVAALLDPSGDVWRGCSAATNPQCAATFVCTNDLNRDGVVDNSDIDAFVACLINSPAPGEPCP